MLDTHKTVIAYLEATLPEFADYADDYGEPGYALEDGATPMVVMANYWCRCSDELHGIDTHYPRTFARLEEQGVSFEWLDEWIVDHENGKAYRTSPDSYSWKPSYVLTDGGDILTPDDDIQEWIDYAKDAERCIPAHVYSGRDLEAIGFQRFNGRYENGWHPGQTDDPKAIDAMIRETHGEDVTIVFVLDDTGQFDIAFSAYFQPSDDEA